MGGIHLFQKHKKLSMVAFILLILGFVIPMMVPLHSNTYTPPKMKNAEAKETYREIAESLGENVANDANPAIMITSNEYLGRYIQDNKLTDKQVVSLMKDVPLYQIEMTGDTNDPFISIDPLTKKLVKADNLSVAVKNDEAVTSFVHKQYGEEFTLSKKQKREARWDETIAYPEGKVTVYTFKSDFNHDHISDQVKVMVEDGKIVLADHFASVDHHGKINSIPFGPMLGLSFGSILVYIVLAVIACCLFVYKMGKRQIVSFRLPFIPAIIALVFTEIATISFEGKLTMASLGFNLFFSVMIYFVLAVFIKTKENVYSLDEWKEPVYVGFLFASIGFFLSTVFYTIATMMGAWSSPSLNFSMLMSDHKWFVVLASLAIGIGAAVSEELTARFAFDKMMSKVPAVLVALFSSFVWALLHLGYEVYPWYLRVIELTFVIGPFIYYVYKKYGLKYSIMLHFFFNSFFSAFELYYYDQGLAWVSSILALFPLLLLLRKSKNN